MVNSCYAQIRLCRTRSRGHLRATLGAGLRTEGRFRALGRWCGMALGCWLSACAEVPERWRVVAGGDGDDLVDSVLFGPSGESWVSGNFQKTVKLGPALLTNDFALSGVQSGFVARLSAGGTADWAFQVGQAAPSEVLALSRSGEVLWVGGTFSGEVQLGSIARTSRGRGDAFLLGCSSSDGAPTDLFSWGGEGSARVQAVTALDDGDLLIGGGFTGLLELGDEPMRAPEGDAFLARISPDGSVRWSRQIGSTGFDSVEGIALCGDDCAAALGTFETAITLGTETLQSIGSADIFVAAVNTRDGTSRWARRIGSDSLDLAGSIVAAPGGELVVAGTATGRLDVGPSSVDDGYPHAFLGRLDATGAIRWLSVLKGPGRSDGHAATVNAEGESVLVGSFSGRVGGTDLVGYQDTADGLALGFDQDGGPQWSYSFGRSGDDVGWAAGVNGSGDLLIGGSLGASRGFDLMDSPAAVSQLLVVLLPHRP